MNLNHDKDGVMYAVLSYLMWGLTPIYWKLVQHVAPGEILAQRVFWSFIFMLILLLMTKKWRTYITFSKEIMKKPTLSLLAGVILYHESLTKAHVIAFSFIWLALVIYTFSSITNWGNRSKKQINDEMKA